MEQSILLIIITEKRYMDETVNTINNNYRREEQGWNNQVYQ